MYNANRGTQRGQALLEKSLQRNGAGRSILLDRHGNIIAGNKTVEAAMSVGLENVVVVQTTGNQVVAVQRMDLDLNEDGGRARQMATEDNRIAELNLEWDLEVLVAQSAEGIQLPGLFNDLEMQEVHAQLANSTAFLNDFATLAAPEESKTATTPQTPAASDTPGEEAAPKPAPAASANDTGEDEGEGVVTDANTAPAPTVEAVKLLFLMPSTLRDQVTKRLNDVKNEHKYPTLAHALCHVLEIPYEG